MAGKRHGWIRQMSDSYFVWDITNVNSFINETTHLPISSPQFWFEGKGCAVNMFRRGNASGEMFYFRLFQYGTNSIALCAKHHGLCIQEVEGANYWISENKKSCVAEHPGLLKSNIRRDFSRITTGGTLSVHLTFYDGSGRSHGEDPTADIPRTADFGTQTSPNIDRKLSIPSDPVGVDELVHNLKDLLLSGQKSDVTLMVGGREFKAHQNILVARSPVFSKMFEQDMLEQASGTVQITDCTAETFQDFLLYLYSGKVETLAVENVIGLYCIADKYDVRPLCAVCLAFMATNFTVDSFCDYVSLALRHCELELLESANMFFPENLKNIVDTQKWEDFTAQNSAEARELLVKALSKVLPA